MKSSLIINGKEFCNYIAEGGISFSKVSRRQKQLTTADGTLYSREIEKVQIQVTLLDNMYDSAFKTIQAYLKTNPATVSYTDFETGTTITNKIFYIKENSHEVKRSYGTISEISGGSFTLEEK